MCSSGIVAGGFPQSHSSSLMSLKKELRSLSGAPIFAAAIREQLYMTWYQWPVRLLLTGSQRTRPAEKELLNTDHPQGTARGNRPRRLVYL